MEFFSTLSSSGGIFQKRPKKRLISLDVHISLILFLHNLCSVAKTHRILLTCRSFSSKDMQKEMYRRDLKKRPMTESVFYSQIPLSFPAQFKFGYGVVSPNVRRVLAKRPLKAICERNVSCILIFLSLLRHSLCLDMESFLPMSWRQRLFERFRFDEPLPFSLSDLGPAGGIQVCVYA